MPNPDCATVLTVLAPEQRVQARLRRCMLDAGIAVSQHARRLKHRLC